MLSGRKGYADSITTVFQLPAVPLLAAHTLSCIRVQAPCVMQVQYLAAACCKALPLTLNAPPEQQADATKCMPHLPCLPCNFSPTGRPHLARQAAALAAGNTSVDASSTHMFMGTCLTESCRGAGEIAWWEQECREAVSRRRVGSFLFACRQATLHCTG